MTTLSPGGSAADDSRSAPVTEPLLSVIVPVCNEVRTVEEVVRRIEALPCRKEIVIVDDGSTDGTTQVLEKLRFRDGIRVVLHEVNQGKGAAIRTALGHARGDLIVIQDADLEYNPADIVGLLKPILANSADVVYGSRFANGSPKTGVVHRAANRGLTWLSNCFTGLALPDMETCYKAMRREVAANLTLREARFGFEPEFTAKIAKRGWRVVELPISYSARNKAAGKKIGVRDGLRAIWCIMRYSLRD